MGAVAVGPGFTGAHRMQDGWRGGPEPFILNRHS